MSRALLAGLLLWGCGDKDPDDTHVEPDDTAEHTGDSGPTDGFHDRLSMPVVPSLDPASFNPATTCAGCHPEHARRWQGSAHAHAMRDPVFQVLVGARQQAFDGAQDPFCTQCHSAIGTRGGEVVPGFAFSDLSPVVMEGVTCEACHKVSALRRVYNSGHVLDPDGPIRGPIADPVDNAFHASEHSPLFEAADFCGGCHDVIEVSGLHLERPFAEWSASPAADEGRPCQSCHMPTTRGPAALGGPERDVHDHRFQGVDIPFDTPEDQLDAARADVEALLRGAGTVLLDAPEAAGPGDTFDLLVTVRNELDAHNLPTGTTFIRQCWVELVVTDAGGRVLYETGTTDADGDLRDHWSALDPYGDPDLLSLSSGLVDGLGSPTVFPWQAVEHTSSALSPLYQRTWTLFVPVPEDATGPLRADARLRFRTFPPFLVRLLGLEDHLDRVQIYDIDAAAIEVPLQP